jgi:plastocyanin
MGVPMKNWFVRGSATAVALVAAVAATSAMASSHASGLTIKATDHGSTYVINKSVTDRMYFSPGTATIKSGQTLTFEYDGMAMSEPHTISIVSGRDLPKTDKQIADCGICNKIAATHIKNPHAPPGPTNDIVHWTVDKGQPGLDEPGDSIAIEGMKHRSVSIKVTAPAGTTLYFICAVHPWMQGEIKVI